MMFVVALVLALKLVSTLAEEFDLHTTDELKYTYYPWKEQTIKFKVKATNDVHFIFAVSDHPDLGSNNQFVEVVIGGWSNGQSVIRRSRTETAKVITQTPQIVDGNEFRGFWVKMVGHNGFMVGKEFETVPLMTWTDPNPIKITHYGLCTGFGSSGDWKVSVEKNSEIPVCEPTKQVLQDKMKGNKKYEIIDEINSWDGAKAACEGRGQRLASVRSKEEQSQLEQAIQNFNNPFSGVWIAANDRGGFGQFKWYDGSNDLVSYTNWENNQIPPREAGSTKNCVFLSYVNLVVKQSANWFLQKCTDNWNFACESHE